MTIDPEAVLRELHRDDPGNCFDDPALGPLFDPPFVSLADVEGRHVEVTARFGDDAAAKPLHRSPHLGPVAPTDEVGGSQGGRFGHGPVG